MGKLTRVLIESRFAGLPSNVSRTYVEAACLDALGRNEAPFASHAFYTAILNDLEAEERELGISAGLRWGEAAELSAFYVDLGFSSGMALGLTHAIAHRRSCVFRAYGGRPKAGIDRVWHSMQIRCRLAPPSKVTPGDLEGIPTIAFDIADELRARLERLDLVADGNASHVLFRINFDGDRDPVLRLGDGL